MHTAEKWRTRWGLLEHGAHAGDTKATIRHEYGPTAIQKRFVQTNPRAMVAAVVVDIDRPSAVMDALARPHEHPAPSWVIETDRGAHVGWWLADPVTRTDAAHEKPLRYLARVQEGLRRSLDADPAYSGFITRNPTFAGLIPGDVIWGTDRQFQLRDMRTGAMPKQLARKPQNVSGDLGRNCALFQSGRHEAYRLNRQMDYPGADGLYRAMISHLLDLNGQMGGPGPLPLAEVRSIASSIATWTSQHHSAETFREIQTKRGHKGGRESGETRRANRENIRTSLKEFLR